MSCSSCNISIADTSGREFCPTCGIRGKSVGKFTINALVSAAKARTDGYPDGFYCVTPDCETLYFFEGDIAKISKDEVIVRVGYKESSQPTTVCYCYGHTLEDIEAEVTRGDEVIIEAQIRAEVERGSCSCEIKNPQGRCCLGEVRAVYAKCTSDETMAL